MSEADEKSAQTGATTGQETRKGESGRGEDVAAALKYDKGSDNAPRVVAKGKGEVARKIIEIARESGIPVREDADLAELLSAIDLDEQIPLEAFKAVAEILAYIYEANREAPAPGTERQQLPEEQD